jgi:DNA-binding MarR family transcriptional regulator
MLGRRWHDPWPPPNRDPDDPALTATRLLATTGRMQTRLRRIARRNGVDPRVFRFLLLFAERKAPLRIADIAETMGVSHQTASRIVTLAIEAGLADLWNRSALDARSTDVRLTVAGRDATLQCLDALRADAIKVGATPAPPRRGWSGAYGIRQHLRNSGPMDEGWVIQGPP